MLLSLCGREIKTDRKHFSETRRERKRQNLRRETADKMEYNECAHGYQQDLCGGQRVYKDLFCFSGTAWHPHTVRSSSSLLLWQAGSNIDNICIICKSVSHTWYSSIFSLLDAKCSLSRLYLWIHTFYISTLWSCFHHLKSFHTKAAVWFHEVKVMCASKEWRNEGVTVRFVQNIWKWTFVLLFYPCRDLILN